MVEKNKPGGKDADETDPCMRTIRCSRESSMTRGMRPTTAIYRASIASNHHSGRGPPRTSAPLQAHYGIYRTPDLRGVLSWSAHIPCPALPPAAAASSPRPRSRWDTGPHEAGRVVRCVPIRGQRPTRRTSPVAGQADRSGSCSASGRCGEELRQTRFFDFASLLHCQQYGNKAIFIFYSCRAWKTDQ